MASYEPVFIDIETTGLHPMAEEWHDNQNYDAQVYVVAFAFTPNWRDAEGLHDLEIVKGFVKDEDEYNLLNRLPERLDVLTYDAYGKNAEPFFVGHNIRKFDFPYLGARFARYRLDGHPFTHGWKRLDTMKVARRDDRTGDDRSSYYTSEDDYADILGVEDNDPYDGSDMPGAFDNGQWDKIMTHVMSDVEVNAKIFFRAKDVCIEEFVDHYDDVDMVFESTEEVDL